MLKFRAPHRPALNIFLQTEAWLALMALFPGAIYMLKDDFSTGLSAFLVCFLVPLPFMLYAFWGYLYPTSSQ